MNTWDLVEGEKTKCRMCVHKRRGGGGKDTEAVRQGRVSEDDWIGG